MKLLTGRRPPVVTGHDSILTYYTKLNRWIEYISFCPLILRHVRNRELAEFEHDWINFIDMYRDKSMRHSLKSELQIAYNRPKKNVAHG